PSFQMSFAATLGLVALVQIGMPRLFASPDNSRTAKVALWGGREIMTLALASLVAGLATTPYAAFHFHRVTPYGVLAHPAALAVPQPDILISGDGHNVGVRGQDGRLHLIRTGKDAFLIKEWLAADADPRGPADPSLADGVSCDEAGCVAQMGGGGFVALALKAEALGDDCERAALLVTTRQAPPSCRSPVIAGDRLRGQGAMALWRTRDGFAVSAIRPKALDRPWSPMVAGTVESDTALPSRPA